jgi:uncharacterized protein
MRIIALEEHFTTPAFLDGPGRGFKEGMMRSGGARAVKTFEQPVEMDAAGLDMQVLSLNFPGTEQADADEAVAVARDANDLLAEAVRKHPKRLAGFATLPTVAPDKAAAELAKRMRGDGFKGAVINGHNRGRYLDDKFYWPIFERAEALGVPIYLHPTRPPQAVIDASFSGFAPDVSFMFSGAGWGWHIETAVHVLRLVLGGVFDRFPKLQIVVGHLGEALPFMLPRLDRNMPPALTKLQRSLGDYLRQNVHYTFGGFFFPATFLDLLLEVGVERIMFSVDYPYGTMTAGRTFLEQIPVSAADRERIAHGNAEKLFKV